MLLAGATLVALALRLAVGLQMTGPMIVGDEAGHLTQAMWLAGGEGYELSSRLAAYYNIGYPLLLVPAMLAGGEDPALTWRLIVVTNAVAGAGLVPLLTAALRLLLGAGPRLSVLAASVASCYPSYILVTGQAWAEIAIPPVFLLWVLSVHGLLRRPGTVAAVLCGLAATATFAVHARTGLPVLAVTFAGALVLLAPAVRRPTTAAALLVTMGASTTLVQLLQQRARAALWTDDASLTGRNLEWLAQGEAPVLALAQLAGTAWAGLAGTLLLAGFGLVALTRVARSPAAQPAARSAVAACLLGVLGTWVLAAAFFVGADRADQYVHGRYLETALALPLAAGLVWLVTASRRSIVRSAAGGGAALVLCAGAVLLVRGDALRTDDFYPFSNSGLLLFGLDVARVDVGIVSAVALAVAAGVVALSLVKRAAGALAVLAVFLTGTAYVASELYLFIDEVRYANWVPPPVPDGADVVALTDAEDYWYEQGIYPFWLPSVVVEQVDLSAPGRPPQRYVLAPPGWPGASDPRTELLWRNDPGTIGLYDQGG
jgi:hypothetical protein